MVRLLFIGDIVGKPGRAVVRQAVRPLVEAESIDLVIANAENSAGGSGLTPANYRELVEAGVDAFTLGDHVYRRREIYKVLESERNIVRPANLPEEAVGPRWAMVQTASGVPVAFACLLGRLFMNPIDSPWRAADALLAEIPTDVKVRLIDFHAEATSEMQQMGRYLDGRVSAVLGTHTHVATADECVLPGGTAFQCDVGMTGPHESIIGRRIDRVLESTLTSRPVPFDVATQDVRLNGTIVDVDEETGLATGVRRVCVDEKRAAELAG
ncbi:YmdB family metallophosphoesterase [Aeoliella sp. ICT_H6.2]|uniref:YmdB family metallophosphoesterase n=1 Tax=Aeoliella straminimaris TaxID=2954799 RepID=A0A9X2JFB9_9BACT|nr:TIGR00282 family metallophosphoesterase [Aeoliella straminimaris]MCO6043526.1 YmdB family metallophosphoesterase [Aeoliella straminimaris]